MTVPSWLICWSCTTWPYWEGKVSVQRNRGSTCLACFWQQHKTRKGVSSFFRGPLHWKCSSLRHCNHHRDCSLLTCMESYQVPGTLPKFPGIVLIESSWQISLIFNLWTRWDFSRWLDVRRLLHDSMPSCLEGHLGARQPFHPSSGPVSASTDSSNGRPYPYPGALNKVCRVLRFPKVSGLTLVSFLWVQTRGWLLVSPRPRQLSEVPSNEK